MKTLSIALLAGLALVAGSAASAASRPAHGPRLGVVPHRGAAHITSKVASRTSTARADATCGTSCSSYEAAIDTYFTDVAHDSGSSSNVYSVATQYCEGVANLANSCNGLGTPIAYNETFAGSFVDTNAYPSNGCTDTYLGTGDTHCLTDLQLEAEIKKVIAAQGWPTGTSDLFFIFTPSDVGSCFDPGSVSTGDSCSTNSFCAYHSNFLDGGSQVVYGVEPDGATIPTGGCDYHLQDPNGASVDPTINTISHEQNEAITDPLGTGWLAADQQSEIGDLCAWTFGAPLGGSDPAEWNQTINGHHYWLQEEYSNAPIASAGCVQYLGGTASQPDPVLKDGTGPLLYFTGPVMQTNTVHAIYWIPSSSGAPANSAAPIVSGVAAVGKTLTTSTGSWSNSPSSYSYTWQSCSSSGTNCVNISGATDSSYTLASGDAGHEIRSEVSATNSSGSSSYVPSTPTAVVVGVPKASSKPQISGKARVGKVLAAHSGTWTNAPTSFRYQWLRCSAKGTSCKRISRATKPAYKLVRRDAGHRLRLRVTATNIAGSASSTSGTTRLTARH